MTTISADTAELLIEERERETVWSYDVETAPSVVRFGPSQEEAVSGTRAFEDDRGTIRVAPGQSVWVYNSDPSGDAEIQVERASFTVSFESRRQFSSGSGSVGPIEQSTDTAEPGQMDLGEYIAKIDVYLDLNAVNNDWVFEVSQDGSNWREHTRVGSADLSTGGEFFQIDTAFEFGRSRYLGADGDVDVHETSAKGVT